MRTEIKTLVEQYLKMSDKEFLKSVVSLDPKILSEMSDDDAIVLRGYKLSRFSKTCSLEMLCVFCEHKHEERVFNNILKRYCPSCECEHFYPMNNLEFVEFSRRVK